MWPFKRSNPSDSVLNLAELVSRLEKTLPILEAAAAQMSETEKKVSRIERKVYRIPAQPDEQPQLSELERLVLASQTHRNAKGNGVNDG